MEDAVDEHLPSRLFHLDHYPTVTKINGYSKPEYLATIAEALGDSEQMNWLLASPFGKLFTIPPNRSSFSGKLVHGMVCRQLVTKKRHEMWMVFAGHPIRFGLREFAILTGLECGKYPKKRAVDKVIAVKEGCRSVWETLFGNYRNLTVADLVDKLKGEEMDMMQKLSIALIIIVDGILTCYTQPVRPSEDTVEMTKDINFFSRYPWGRLSFSRTLAMISGFNTKEDVDEKVASLKQQSLVCHGFPLAIQLLAFEAVPSLCKLIPPEEVGQAMYAMRSIHNLAKLRPIRTTTILQCEAANDVEVRCIIPSKDPICEDEFVWKDERDDPKVLYMETLIHSDHKWEENEWWGGDAECEKLIRPGEKGKGKVCKRKRDVAAKVERKKQKASSLDEDESNANVVSDEDDRYEPFVVELRRFFRKQTAQQEQFQKDLKLFVRQEIHAAFAAKGSTTPQKSSGKKKRRIITLSKAGKKRKSERLNKKTSSLNAPSDPSESGFQANTNVEIGEKAKDGEDSSTHHETLQDDAQKHFDNMEGGKVSDDGSVKEQTISDEQMADIGANTPQEKPTDGDDVFYDAPDGGKESKEGEDAHLLDPDSPTNIVSNVSTKEGEDAHVLDPDSPTNIVSNVLFHLSSTTGVHDTLHPTTDDEAVLGAAENSGFSNLNVDFGNTAPDQSDLQGGLAPPDQSPPNVDGSTQVDPVSKSECGAQPTDKAPHVPGPSHVNVTLDQTHVEGGVAPSDHGASVDPCTHVDANLKPTLSDGGMESSDKPGSSTPGVDVAKSAPNESIIQDLNEADVEDENSQTDVGLNTIGQSERVSPRTDKEVNVPGPSHVNVSVDPTHVEGEVEPFHQGGSVDPSTQVGANPKHPITDGGVESSDKPEILNPGVDVANSVPTETKIQDLNEAEVEDENSQADVGLNTIGQFVTKKVFVISDTPGTSNPVTEEIITVPFKDKEPEILVTAGSVPYHPMDKVDEGKFSRLEAVLAGAHVMPRLFGYHPVTKDFFPILAKPGEWVQSGHMDMMAQLLWRKCGEAMIRYRTIIVDSFLTTELQRRFHDFSQCKKKEGFPWADVLLDICKGERMHRTPKLQWMKDVDIIYAPMNWKLKHWVGLLINLKERVVNIFDPLLIHTRETVVKKRIQPIMEMIPYLVKEGCKDFIPKDYPVTSFSYYRILSVSQNARTGDCGPCSMKFMEMQCHRLPLPNLSKIEEADVDNFRKMYALEIYEHGVGPLA